MPLGGYRGGTDR